LILIAGIVAASLAAGIALQVVSPGVIIVAVGVLGLWLLGILLWDFNISRSLMMISTIYLFPLILTFYFALAILVLSLVAGLYKSRLQTLKLLYPMEFFVLLGCGIVALTKTHVSDGYLYFITSVIVPPLVFLVLGNSRKLMGALATWVKVIGVVATIVALAGIYLALTHPNDRIGSTWANAMTINGFYALAFFFCLALFAKADSRKFKAVWLGCAVTVFLGMMFTYTRIAMLAVIFGLMLLMIKFRRIRMWGLLTICFIPLIIPSSMMTRGDIGAVIDISILIRLVAWYKAVGVIAAHPLFGIGFSTWSEIYRSMIPTPILYAQHAHNVYINLILDMGIIGTIAYLTVIYKSMYAFYKTRIYSHHDFSQYCIWVGMLSLLFSCLTDIFIQQYTISLLFWITLALMAKSAEEASEQLVAPEVNVP